MISQPSKTCSVDGCEQGNYARGLCRSHYDQTPERQAVNRAYRATPEVKARARVHSATPERKAKQRALNATPGRKAYLLARGANPKVQAASRASRLRIEYDGLTVAEWDAIRCDQIGLCPWCDKPLVAKWHNRSSHTDHDEPDGVVRVRAIVHAKCNQVDIAAIDKLIARYGIDTGCPPAMRWYFTDPPAQRVLVRLREAS